MTHKPNIYSPEIWNDPHPFYSALRREAPVSQVEPGGMWAVTRYEDVLYVLKNPQLFSSEGFRPAVQPAWLQQRNPVADSILMMDPPTHTRLRALITRTFSAQGVARLEPYIRESAGAIVADMLARRRVDFMAAMALVLPSRAMSALLGLDPSLAPRFKTWADAVTGVGIIPAEDMKRRAELTGYLDELKHHLTSVLELRQREPGNDVVTDLLQARAQGGSMSDDELLGYCVLLLVAGLETTYDLLGMCALTLVDNPDLWVRLKKDRALVPRFVEEVLRFHSPSQSTIRTTTQETELGGVRLPKGATVLVQFVSASRDESVYPNAHHFDLERTGGAPSLAFGQGIHFCVGAPLARLEARLALEALLERCDRMVREPGPVTWNVAITTRGPAVLPLELFPA